MSPGLTSANTKLPPKSKWTVKLHPPIALYIIRTLIDRSCKIVRQCHWIQRRGAILGLLLFVLLAIVRQQKDLKMRSQQPLL